MLSKDDLTKVYDTVFSIPGMNESVKIDLRTSRKNLLVLSKVIERGLSTKGEEKEGTLLSILSPEIKGELENLALDLLQKGGLTEVNENLKKLF